MWKRDCLNNGKTDSLGARGPARTDGWTEGDGTRGPAPQHLHRAPMLPEPCSCRTSGGRGEEVPAAGMLCKATVPSQPCSPQNAYN